MKLYMVMLGCKPKGRFTEQHDIFFGIGNSLKELIPQMDAFWPEAKGKLHIDAWREITVVDNYSITVLPKTENVNNKQLFFINLGGYKENEFEEYHYKLLTVAEGLSEATKTAKKTAFYKHCGFDSPAAVSHIDDKYGIDVDDIYNVEDILPLALKSNYSIAITKSEGILQEDPLHIGYVKISSL